MTETSAQPIDSIVREHVQEAADLRNMRSVSVRSPSVRLAELRRLDERLAAHLDGITVAGDTGTDLCLAALERPVVGTVFVAVWNAIQRGDLTTIRSLIGFDDVDARRGIVSAFGWADKPALRGLVKPLLGSPSARERGVALDVCRLHGVAPGPHAPDSPPKPSPSNDMAGLRLALLSSSRAVGKDLLSDVAHVGSRRPEGNRSLVRAVGWFGDPAMVGWLIDLMSIDRVARLAGESFSLITGVDLPAERLERDVAPVASPEPTDDVVDDDMSIDEDDGLPWPDSGRVRAWWRDHAARFASFPCFMGAPPCESHCLETLRTGHQRQRIVGAVRMKLLQPERPLFNVCAPAWRQQRALMLS